MTSPNDPELRRLRGRIGAYTSWANTADRSSRTRPGREAFLRRFLAEADGDPRRAESLMHAHFARLALVSRQRRAERKAAERQSRLERLAEAIAAAEERGEVAE